jgi:hypothetical protein
VNKKDEDAEMPMDIGLRQPRRVEVCWK